MKYLIFVIREQLLFEISKSVALYKWLIYGNLYFDSSLIFLPFWVEQKNRIIIIIVKYKAAITCIWGPMSEGVEENIAFLVCKFSINSPIKYSIMNISIWNWKLLILFVMVNIHMNMAKGITVNIKVTFSIANRKIRPLFISETMFSHALEWYVFFSIIISRR